MDAESFYFFESQVDWYEETNAELTLSPSRLIAELGDLDDGGPATDEYHWDWSNIRMIKPSSLESVSQSSVTFPTLDIMDSTAHDATSVDLQASSVSSTGNTPKSLGDSGRSQANNHSAYNGIFQSPSLYSDSEQSSMDNSILETDLPSFVVNCRRKPLMPAIEMTNNVIMNTNRNVKCGNSNSNKCEVVDNQNKELLCQPCYVKFDNTSTSCKMPDVHCKGSLKEEISALDFHGSGTSPLDQEAQKKFDIIDRCLVIKLAPVLETLGTNNKVNIKGGFNSTHSNPPLTRREKALLMNKSKTFVDVCGALKHSQCAMGHGDNDVTFSKSDRSVSSQCVRKKRVRIEEVPMNCKSVQEIQRLEEIENKYLCLDLAFKRSRLLGAVDGNRNKSEQRPKELSSSYNPELISQSLTVTAPTENTSNEDTSQLQNRNFRRPSRLKSNRPNFHSTNSNTRSGTVSHSKDCLVSANNPDLQTLSSDPSTKPKSITRNQLSQQNVKSSSQSAIPSHSDFNSPLVKEKDSSTIIPHPTSTCKPNQECSASESQGFVPCMLEAPSDSFELPGPLPPINSTQPFTPRLTDSCLDGNSQSLY